MVPPYLRSTIGVGRVSPHARVFATCWSTAASMAAAASCLSPPRAASAAFQHVKVATLLVAEHTEEWLRARPALVGWYRSLPESSIPSPEDRPVSRLREPQTRIERGIGRRVRHADTAPLTTNARRRVRQRTVR